MEDDIKIIEKVKNGDTDAFDELVIKYQKRLYNIAYRMLNNHEDALDASQEAFVNAYKGINSFRQESSFYYWLSTILNNICKNKMRKYVKDKTLKASSIQVEIESDDGTKVVKEVADSSPSPFEKLEKKEKDELVQKALDKLPPDLKTVVLLYDFDGLSYDAIAEICKCPIGTVRSRLHRGRVELKEILKSSGTF